MEYRGERRLLLEVQGAPRLLTRFSGYELIAALYPQFFTPEQMDIISAEVRA